MVYRRRRSSRSVSGTYSAAVEAPGTDAAPAGRALTDAAGPPPADGPLLAVSGIADVAIRLAFGTIHNIG